MDIAAQLIADFGIAPFQVHNTIRLLTEGSTIPFVARYRKECTGNLDETQVRELWHKYCFYRELDQRRTTILDSIRLQGKLTAELEQKINQTKNKTELEDLYLPYKPLRITRGKKARQAKLEPLARWLVEVQDPEADPVSYAAQFINPQAGFETSAKALQGACDILSDELSDDATTRKWLRDLVRSDGFIVSQATKEFEKKKTKYEMYYAYRERISSLVSHRILAMFRGEREGVLSLKLDFPKDQAVAYLEKRLITHPGLAVEPVLRATARDALERLLLPATETEIRNELRERAEEEACKVFGENLRTLLMAPPAGRKPTLGIDPGFRSGCKIAAVDGTGKLLHYAAIYPHEPHNDVDGSRAILLAFVQKYNIQLIAIGNGTAARETENFVRLCIGDIPPEQRPVCVLVNESGASVYSASEIAKRELPDHDITVRGAVSIARRLQDPLSELVKIDPKAIGVGQYQHDVNQRRLKQCLEEIVESCVNQVGVDVNLASEELLKYVSGLNRATAAAIVKYRNENGPFSCRVELLKVPGLGEKRYEQAAGFLRIPGAANPLDNSAVHPERYGFVEALAQKLSTSIEFLIGNTALLNSVDKQSLVSDDIGMPTIEDILAELEKPGRDPRESFEYATFAERVKSIEDLKEGMVLQGYVTNVTNFGAFVDLGVHQDGLIHISELANRFVKDPHDVVKVGQIVNVVVTKIDAALKRISLSMKIHGSKVHKIQRPPTKKTSPTSLANERKKVSAAAVASRPPQTHCPTKTPSQRQPGTALQAPIKRPQSDRSVRQQQLKQQPTSTRHRHPRPSTIEDLKRRWMASPESGATTLKKLKTVKPKFSIKELLP